MPPASRSSPAQPALTPSRSPSPPGCACASTTSSTTAPTATATPARRTATSTLLSSGFLSIAFLGLAARALREDEVLRLEFGEQWGWRWPCIPRTWGSCVRTPAWACPG